jgi:hypothetical protein
VECVPGCGHPPQWCEGDRTSGCPFRPTALASMMTAASWTTYNEIIIDSLFYEQHLPHSIEAFVTMGGTMASTAHAEFLSAYGLTSRDVPLVHWTGWSFDEVQV